MEVKHWSFAGLMLSYWCGARCASCYLCCGAEFREWMSPELALAAWKGLQSASPHGCRVHVSGGEPFGDWERLIQLCRVAHEHGLGPLEKVETNAFWAIDERIVRDRLRELDHAGMQTLGISADPYHQQFVPIERCRLAARVAGEVLGEDRVQVRWRDWLAEGYDTASLDDHYRQELFAHYAANGRDRFNGRAADLLTPHLPSKEIDAFAGNHCRESLLRGRHVHIDPHGQVMPGTCAGISLGDASRCSIPELWERLVRDHSSRPIVDTLARLGPAGLAQEAIREGFVPRRYASKCHLCWSIRRFLYGRGLYREELAPARLYEPVEENPSNHTRSVNVL